jgi:hypothetical protein
MDRNKLINLNLIPDRIKHIETLVCNKALDSMIDFKNTSSTDTFENMEGTEDIRELLPKKYLDFTKAINELGGKLLYIKSGSTGHTFKGVHLDNTKMNYAVKIVAYPKKENYGDMYNIKRPENTEIAEICAEVALKNCSIPVVSGHVQSYKDCKLQCKYRDVYRKSILKRG